MEKSVSSRRLQPKRLHNFYKSDVWHKVREEVILRAKGKDVKSVESLGRRSIIKYI